jgi:hypothetical protein
VELKYPTPASIERPTTAKITAAESAKISID